MSDIPTKTDEEVICEWMEPPLSHERVPIRLTLDRLHAVEARLNDKQWQKYLGEFLDDEWHGWRAHRNLLHATAAQKIAALAAVIRAERT